MANLAIGQTGNYQKAKVGAAPGATITDSVNSQGSLSGQYGYPTFAANTNNGSVPYAANGSYTPEQYTNSMYYNGDNYVDRGLVAGNTTSWGEQALNIWDQYGNKGGGGTPTAPTPVSYSPVSYQNVDPVLASYNWVSPATNNGGGGGGGGGTTTANNPWSVTKADVGGMGYDPSLMNQVDPVGGYQDYGYSDFNNIMSDRMKTFMSQQLGYSPEEMAGMRSAQQDGIYAGMNKEIQSSAANMMRSGIGPNSGQYGANIDAVRRSRQREGANADRDLMLANENQKRTDQNNQLNMGMQYSQIQQQYEQQRNTIQSQIEQANANLNLAVQQGNQEAINAARSSLMNLKGQAEMLNSQMSNDMFAKQKELLNQKQIAQMNNSTQKYISNQNYDIAKNQSMMQLAMQNADIMNNMGQFNASNLMNSNQFNTSNQLNLDMFNAGRTDTYNNQLYAAANAGRNQDYNAHMDAFNLNLQQQQYEYSLMMQLYGLQNNAANNMINWGNQYSQNVYQSNPNAYTDPYSYYGSYY